MKLNREARKQSRELYSFALVNGRLDADRARQIADTLIAAKPRHYVQILQEFTRLIRIELLKRHARITSAAPLDGQTQSTVQNEILNKFGADFTLDFAVDPALIGGMRVQVASDVWDGSIRSRLEALRQIA
jgi:F-type H+-transporting ATPase subunit delta